MKNKIVFVIILILFFSLATKGQELLQGQRFSKNGNITDNIFYLYKVDSSRKMYFNKYFVFKNKNVKDTLYVVELNYDKYTDSIEIKKVDKHTNMIFKKSIKFQDTKPICCVKNYKLNDTTLTLTDKNLDILFTVADTTNPKLFLHQFVSNDGDYYFNLLKFRNSHLTPHLTSAFAYWISYKEKRKDSIRSTQQYSLIFQQAVSNERNQLESERKQLLDELKVTKTRIQSKREPATDVNQFQFVHKIDTIFSKYLSKTYPFPYRIKGTYTVCSQPKTAVNEVTNNIEITDDGSIFRWFYSKKFAKIDSVLSVISLDQNTKELSINDKLDLMNDMHTKRCNSKSINKTLFQPLLDSINIEISAYKIIPVATLYTYIFAYTSTTEWGKWALRKGIFTNIKDSSKKIEDINYINSFNKIIPHAKNGRYKVRLNSSELTSSSMKINKFGPEVDSVYRTSKFMTHVGLSIGFIATDETFSKSNIAISTTIPYWNLFYIRHHMGVFVGYSGSPALKSYYQSTIYLEGGMYLAPWNYFYFKAGLANYSNITSALFGASLIFPIFQIEGGYNFAFKDTYIMLGFNIPFNR